MDQCPICFKSFPLQFLERHVNTCLDTHEGLPKLESGDGEPLLIDSEAREVEEVSQSSHIREAQNTQLCKTPEGKRSNTLNDPGNVFAALGLKTNHKLQEKLKKASATLTSILIAEKRLKRKQEGQEMRTKRQALEQPEPEKHSPEITGPVGNQDDERHQNDQSRLKNESHQEDQGISMQEGRQSSSATLQGSKEGEAAKYLQLKRESELPLAQRLRPQSLDDYFGQEKLMGQNGVLRNLIQSPNIPSFILWGEPGVGKTSLARIVAKTSDHKFIELSGADSNAKKLKEAFSQAVNEKALTGRKTILFLDEIHRFNKAVQDLLLPVIEKGTVVVIGATTENPSFKLNNALLSRMHTFVMDPLSEEALVKILNRGLLLLNKTRKFVHHLHLIALDRSAIDHIARISSGDSRVALNILESINAYLLGLQAKEFEVAQKDKECISIPKGNVGVIRVSQNDLQPLLSSRNYHQKYDRNGENHYDTISAFHKAVRGSNADAAIFYLTRMLKGGEDPLFIARRMIIIASEDIGLRDSSCLPFAIAAMEAVQFVGMPEGEIVLAHCTAKLARAPKSTKSYRALRNAQSFLSENPDAMTAPIPLHLRNAPTALMKDLGYGESYKYNPNYKHGIVKQSFMPTGFEDVKLVEDNHLGTQIDHDVEKRCYDLADEEEEKYNAYKRWKKAEQKVSVEKPKLHRKAPSLFLSSEGERVMSYDENLSRDDQPEFFDGTENDINDMQDFEV